MKVNREDSRQERGQPMSAYARENVLLGDLIEAAFDKAAQYSADPEVVSHLATSAVTRMLRRARKTSAPPSLPATFTRAADPSQWT